MTIQESTERSYHARPAAEEQWMATDPGSSSATAHKIINKATADICLHTFSTFHEGEMSLF